MYSCSYMQYTIYKIVCPECKKIRPLCFSHIPATDYRGYTKLYMYIPIYFTQPTVHTCSNNYNCIFIEELPIYITCRYLR